MNPNLSVGGQATERYWFGAKRRSLHVPFTLASVGAVLVHLVEYHLGLNANSAPLATVAYMLAHCPMRGGLLVVSACALLTGLALLCELSRLRSQKRRLTVLAERAGGREPRPRPRARSSLAPERALRLFVLIACGQIGLYALLGHLWPMVVAMRMHGVLMDMALPGAVPLAPLHLVVAAVLSVAGCVLERRFQLLHAEIEAARRMLAWLLAAGRGLPFPLPSPARRPFAFAMPSSLPRPPPA